MYNIYNNNKIKFNYCKLYKVQNFVKNFFFQVRQIEK